MTPEFLQNALCDELKKILKNERFEDSNGDLVEMNIFAQNIPVVQYEDEDEPVPYVIVRIVDGETDMNGIEPYSISTVLIIGVHEKTKDNQGHRQILNVINAVYERFSKDPMLDNQYYCDGHLKWTIQDDGYYPYSFGAIRLDFTIPAIRRESEFV